MSVHLSFVSALTGTDCAADLIHGKKFLREVGSFDDR